MSLWAAAEAQIRLRQIRRSPAEHLVLLLEEADPLLQLPSVRRTLTRPISFINVGLTEPVLQGRFADTEVGSDLFDDDAALTAASNCDDVLTERSGIRTGHNDILPASASQR